MIDVRLATHADWPRIWPWLHEIIGACETFALDASMPEDEVAAMWFAQRATVAIDTTGDIVGSAKMGANRAGPGAHIATASYAVNPTRHGQGIGRTLVTESLRWAREENFHGMQFNAVVESNAGAVKLYESLGFSIVGTVPEAFRHPSLGLVGLHVMYCPL